jgi:CheY-like chemotaxis protein
MVLVVDDFPDLCQALKTLLRANGLEAHCAFNAQEAETFLQSQTPEVMILDHAMPGKTGLELLRDLKANPRLADVQVVMFSASNDQRDIQQARELGAVEWVVKASDRWDYLIDRVKELHSTAA